MTTYTLYIDETELTTTRAIIGPTGDDGSITSVNGDAGPAVVLDAADVGARASSWVPDWSDVTGKPTTYTPSSHVHVIGDTTGLQAALDAKAALVSPALTGIPTSPTATFGTNTTQIASTAFVQSAVAAVSGGLPSYASNFGKSLTVNSAETAGEWTFPDAYCYLSAGYTLTSTTATQKLFNASTNGTLTLPTGRYWFEMLVRITAMSGVSGNGIMYLKGAGTAVLANGLAAITGLDGAATSGVAFTSGIAPISGGEFTLVPAVGTTATEVVAVMWGHFSVTTAGTIIPSIALTTAAAASVNAGSSFICRRIGGTATTNGSWT